MFLKEMEIPKKTWLRGDHLNNVKDSNVDKDIDENLNDGVIEEPVITMPDGTLCQVQLIDEGEEVRRMFLKLCV